MPYSLHYTKGSGSPKNNTDVSSMTFCFKFKLNNCEKSGEDEFIREQISDRLRFVPEFRTTEVCLTICTD